MRHGDNSRLEDFSHWPSDDELHETIEEAIKNLAREGLIVDTGRRRWSERSGRYEIVWRSRICTESLN
jgi:hypothetical protein